MDVIARSEFEKLDRLNRWEHVERLQRERDALLAVRREWEQEHARLTAQLRGAVEQIDEALKLLEARRAPGGQIPLAAESADRVLALLRAAAGGQ